MPSSKLVKYRPGSLEDDAPPSWLTSLIATLGGRRNIGAGSVLAATVAAVYFIHSPYWIGAGIFVFGISVTVFLAYTKPKRAVPIETKAKHWYRRLIASMKDYSNVTIYLRHMDSPRNFSAPYKSQLLEVMNEIARNVLYNKNMSIITQHLDNDAVVWLNETIFEMATRDNSIHCDQVNISQKISKTIHVIQQSFIDNRSSIYVFGDSRVFFTLVNPNESVKYYVFYMAGSIVPELIRLGITHYVNHNSTGLKDE